MRSASGYGCLAVEYNEFSMGINSISFGLMNDKMHRRWMCHQLLKNLPESERTRNNILME